MSVMVDEATDEGLERLASVWGVVRSEALRKSVRQAVEALAGKWTVERSVESPVRPELVTIVEERKPVVPGMMTARELFAKQQRERERRRGDETDQRPGNEDDL